MRIVAVSNPFGYGPTGNLVTAVSAIHRVQPTWKFTFLTDTFTESIIPEEYPRHTTNLRDSEGIASLLDMIKPNMVLSGLNRFSVMAARSRGIPSAVLDTLTWFWREVPCGLLDTDLYLYSRFPGCEHVAQLHHNAVPLPRPNLEISRSKRDSPWSVLVHLGGGKTPFSLQPQRKVLSFLAEAIVSLSLPSTTLLVGGRDVVEILREHPVLSKYSHAALGKEAFEHALQSASLFISTPGFNATMEAFSLSVPTILLPGMNLSQAVLSSRLVDHGVNAPDVLWENLSSVPCNLSLCSSEQEAISLIEDLSTHAALDRNAREMLHHSLRSQQSSPISPELRLKFIQEQLGCVSVEEYGNLISHHMLKVGSHERVYSR